MGLCIGQTWRWPSGHGRCWGKGARTDERPPGPAFMPLFFTAKCVMSVDISLLQLLLLLLLLHAASRAACGSKAVQCSWTAHRHRPLHCHVVHAPIA